MRGRAAAAGFLLTLAALASPAGAANRIGPAAVGTVTFEDGSPAAGARVVLIPGGYNASTDAAGSFRIEAPAGNYTVRASAANTTAEVPLVLAGIETSNVSIRIVRGGGAASGGPLVAFLFLGLSMVAVALGGFYVNKRMAESGIDLNKSVVGGATLRKPFRRRRKKRKVP